MILIHGDCGSGKSRALHALELAPPADLSVVYVPVPTLEFAGLARWCLDRLNTPPGEDPIAAFRAVVGQRRVLVLIDDAPRLPLESALALRQFERNAKGNLAIVAACGSEEQGCSSVVALGAPAACIALEPERGRGAEAVAAEVRAAFSGGAKQRAAAPPRPQQIAVRAPEVPRVTAEPARASELPAPAPRARELPVPAPARAPAPSPALVAIAKPPRTVPLSLTLALVGAAFLIPVAFGAGFVFGRQPVVAALAVSASPDLAPVASAPPEPSERERGSALAPVEPLAPAREKPEKSLAREAAASAGFARREPARAPAPPPAVAARAAQRVVASAPRVSARSSDSPTVVESWGTPSLISVAPAGDAP